MMPKRTTDKKLLERLAREAPEVLSERVDFDALVETIVSAGSDRLRSEPERRDRPAKSKAIRTAK